MSSIAVKSCRFSYLDWIQEYLLAEIILRLPMKTIYCYKSVSKRWYNLISTDEFVSCYIRHMNATGTSQYFSGVICTKPVPCKGKGITLAYSSNSLFESPGFLLQFLSSSLSYDICVLSSDNGLLLCANWWSYPVIKYTVCNPLTKNWIMIPSPPSSDEHSVRVGFLCRPPYQKSSCSSFFVVRVPNYRTYVNPSVTKAEIYDSEIGEWTQVDLEVEANWNNTEKLIYCPDCYGGRDLNAIVCKELLHWKCCGFVFVFNPYYNNITNKKSMGQNKMVSLPVGSHGKNDDDFLGEYKGRLRYAHLDYNGDCTTWELPESNHNDKAVGVGEYWRMVHKISFYKLTPNQHKFAKGFQPGTNFSIMFLSLHPFDADIIFVSIGDMVVSCNMQEKTISTASFCLPNNEVPIPCLIVLPWWPLKVSHIGQD